MVDPQSEANTLLLQTQRPYTSDKRAGGSRDVDLLGLLPLTALSDGRLPLSLQGLALPG
jgi:hypothetical protein